MLKKLKSIPNFENDDQEREFWSSHDSTEHIDWDQADVSVLPKLKPSTRKISLRLSESMLNEIQILANKIDIPHQSLIKMFLKEKISDELQLFGVANQAVKRTEGKARHRLP